MLNNIRITDRPPKCLGKIAMLVTLGLTAQGVMAASEFEPKVEYSISGTAPVDIILGDFNNDTIDDMAVSVIDGTGGSLSILYGVGSGIFGNHFQMATTTGAGVSYMPAGLTSGDFNNDGRLDLAVTAGGSNTAEVHIYLSAADGTTGFTHATTLISGGTPTIAVVAADFNNDGNLDLAAANALSGAGISVFTGNGDGTFSTAQNVPSSNAVASTDVIAVDVDKDNDIDLVTPRLIFYNGGNADFNLSNNLERQGTPLHIVPVDLNRDTWVDMVLSGEGGVATYVNDQSGVYGFVDRGFVTGPLRGHTAGDFNRDGNADVAFVKQDTNELRIFIGDGTGSLDRAAPLIIPVGTEPNSIVSGDFNRDGMLDIAIPNRNGGSPSVSVLLQHDPNAPPPPLNLLPVANAGGPYTGTAGSPLQFDGAASTDPDGTIVSYQWDFGDNNTGSGINPSNTYATNGNFTVTLTVTDDQGATSTATTTATIGQGNQAPVADPNGPYEGIINTDISFDGAASSDPDGTIASYLWEFGDGTTGSGMSVTHSYTTPGTYNVTLTVTDDAGAIDSAGTTAVIRDTVNQPPVANASGPYTGTVGVPVAFNGTSSSDVDGSIVRYDWNFGDGTIADDAGPAPTHTYLSDGSFTVTLTVTDDVRNTSTDSTTATIGGVANQLPLANANGPYSGVVGLEVQFDGSGSSDPDGTIVLYRWDFGDGNTGTGINPTHIYTTNDTFTVTLTVSDDMGELGTATTTATIAVGNAPPMANANGPYTGIAGVAVLFNGSGSSDPEEGPLTYAWDFGDGNVGTGVNPTHTYTAAGIYNVTLAVTDDTGITDSDMTTATITANVPPTPGGVDLEIDKLKVDKRHYLGEDDAIEIKLKIENNGTSEASTIATVTGTQNDVEVYRQSMMVTVPADDDEKFEFPEFNPTQSGRIYWVATIDSDSPDAEQATASTKVKASESINSDSSGNDEDDHDDDD